MKPFFAILFAVLFLRGICTASVILAIPEPYDDGPVKREVWYDLETNQQVMSDRARYNDLERRVGVLSEIELQVMFGPAKPVFPALLVLPVHHRSMVGFSSLGYRGTGEPYFLAIGEVGGLLVFPYGDGSFISAVALYLKTDDGFVPLQKRTDYAARSAWEIRRTDELRQEIEASFAKLPPRQAVPVRLPSDAGQPLTLEAKPILTAPRADRFGFLRPLSLDTGTLPAKP